MLKFAVSSLSFIVAVAGTAVFLDRLLPPLPVPVVDEKRRFLQEHAQEFDTLFIGSSRTFHHIDPLLFDRLTKEAGRPTKSFNFGITAMFPPEDGYIVERLLPLNAGRLQRVFIELSFLPALDVVNAETVRKMHWHDAHRLALVFQEIVHGDEPGAVKPKNEGVISFWKALQARPGSMTRGGALLVHAQMYLRRLCNVGRGVRWLSSSPPRPALNPALLQEFARTHGARLLPADKKPSAELLASFERLRAQRERVPSPWLPLSAACEANLKDVVSRVRAAGAEPILFIAPELMPCRRFAATEPDLVILDFSEVAQFPRLFDPAQRIDISHVDSAGALEFTRAFARMFLEHEKAHGR